MNSFLINLRLKPRNAIRHSIITPQNMYIPFCHYTSTQSINQYITIWYGLYVKRQLYKWSNQSIKPIITLILYNTDTISIRTLNSTHLGWEGGPYQQNFINGYSAKIWINLDNSKYMIWYAIMCLSGLWLRDNKINSINQSLQLAASVTWYISPCQMLLFAWSNSGQSPSWPNSPYIAPFYTAHPLPQPSCQTDHSSTCTIVAVDQQSNIVILASSNGWTFHECIKLLWLWLYAWTEQGTILW